MKKNELQKPELQLQEMSVSVRSKLSAEQQIFLFSAFSTTLTPLNKRAGKDDTVFFWFSFEYSSKKVLPLQVHEKMGT